VFSKILKGAALRDHGWWRKLHYEAISDTKIEENSDKTAGEGTENTDRAEEAGDTTAAWGRHFDIAHTYLPELPRLKHFACGLVELFARHAVDCREAPMPA
jgi:hypothetical protein